MIFMDYMDGKDKSIQTKMAQEGKVKISNFDEMVQNYFKSKYNLEGYFSFVSVVYTFYDKNYKVYRLDTGTYVSGSQNRSVKDFVPCFIEPNCIDDIRTFSLTISGVIDIDHLDLEISKQLPKGVTYISDNKIKEILWEEGYKEPFFDHYFYSMMDYPDYDVYARPVVRMATQIVEGRKESHLKQPLKQIGVTDTENFPQNCPEPEVCGILEHLFSQNLLMPRKVRYCITTNTETRPSYMTDYFDEYCYNDRRFIRYEATTDMPNGFTLSNDDNIKKGQAYWIEVTQAERCNEYPDLKIGKAR